MIELFAYTFQEIRTPLSVAQGFAEILKDHWQHLSDQERNDTLDIVITRIKNATERTNWLLMWKKANIDK